MLASVRLEEKSLVSCAVSSWRDRLYLAWTGTDYHINLASSADGRTITGKQRLARKSLSVVHIGWVAHFPLPPALTASDTRLWLAWWNCGNLFVCDAEHPGRPRPLHSEWTAGSPPSLTATEPGDLAVAYTIGFRRRVHLLTMTEDPSGGSLLTRDRSRLDGAEYNPNRGGIALCRHEGRLILAWTGTDRRIHVLTMAADEPGAPARLEETSSSWSRPALCSHQGRLILAWTGTDRHIYLLTLAADEPGAPARLEETRSSCAPALCSHQGRLILAWTGTDGRIHLGSVQ